jgi:hypothetical protein
VGAPKSCRYSQNEENISYDGPPIMGHVPGEADCILGEAFRRLRSPDSLWKRVAVDNSVEMSNISFGKRN